MFKHLFLADLKMMIRNKQALFWAFMFPLMFSLIFGLFFGENSTSGSVAIINQSQNEIATSYVGALKESGIFKTIEDLTLDEAKDEIKKTKLIGAVVIPESFGILPSSTFPPAQESDDQIKVVIDPGNAQTNLILVGFTEKFLVNLNMKIQNTQEIFKYKTVLTNDRKLTYFDFVLAGILGLAVMNSSIIGISVAMSKYREDKILKRITTTPLPTWVFIVSEVLSRILLNLAQIAAILLIGLYIFSANIYGNIFLLVGIAVVGAILFQLMGFAVAAFSKTTDAAQGMATAITIPMMFLAGVFFPIDSLPRWLASIVQYLPLAPLLRMLRAVALENESPFLDPKNAIIVLGWIVAMLIISIWKFRLTEE